MAADAARAGPAGLLSDGLAISVEVTARRQLDSRPILRQGGPDAISQIVAPKADGVEHPRRGRAAARMGRRLQEERAAPVYPGSNSRLPWDGGLRGSGDLSGGRKRLRRVRLRAAHRSRDLDGGPRRRVRTRRLEGLFGAGWLRWRPGVHHGRHRLRSVRLPAARAVPGPRP